MIYECTKNVYFPNDPQPFLPLRHRIETAEYRLPVDDTHVIREYGGGRLIGGGHLGRGTPASAFFGPSSRAVYHPMRDAFLFNVRLSFTQSERRRSHDLPKLIKKRRISQVTPIAGRTSRVHPAHKSTLKYLKAVTFIPQSTGHNSSESGGQDGMLAN